MPEAGATHDTTDTDLFPVYVLKADMMTDLIEKMEQRDMSGLREILNRISNTDTDDFTDPTARHD